MLLKTRRLSSIAAAVLTTAALAWFPTLATAAGGSTHVTGPFKGAKVNGGTVTYAVVDGKDTLTLSDDFQTPAAPAPHWQVVDSRGNVYLLQRLMVKSAMSGTAAPDKLNRTITLPAYIQDVAKVQVWCAWAETLLGETSFDSGIKLGGCIAGPGAQVHTSSMFRGVKANTGTVTHSHQGGKCTLTLSEDFQAPDAPAPHWQVVDSRGNVYLLQSLNIKGEGAGTRMNRSIVVPGYVPDIAKVQMWCAYAEVLLGEATFDAPVM